jgi:ceramide glucosyltransferase
VTLGTLVRDALLLIALAPFAFYLLAIVAARRFWPSPRDTVREPYHPPLSILKPVRGLDREAYENFASFCRQDYPEFELLFAATDDSDPAIPIIRQLIADFPERPIRMLIGSEAQGASDKVNKLCRMVREARHEILVVSDSDVRVEPGFLRAIAQPFRDPEIGGVTCLYRGLTDGSFASDLEALGNSTDFAPGVLAAWQLGRMEFMLGAIMVTSKSRLDEIDGFEALADYFCDDYELGNRIASHGHRIELSRFPVSINYPRQTIGEVFRHQVRWNLSIRYSRPEGHFGLLFAQGLAWTVLAAIIAPSAWIAWCYIAAYGLLRGAVALSVGVRGMRDVLVRRRFWMIPLRDAFAFLVWLASFLPQRIHWRGQEFVVREKRLVPIIPKT